MKKYYLTLLSIALVASFSTTTLAAKKNKPAKKAAPVAAAPASFLNEYPTRDRVEFVLNCIAQKDGNLSKMNYVTQYACGCKIDKIAEKMSFADFEAAKTFGYLSKQAGDAGGVFRDPAQAKDLKTRMKEAEEYAQKACFVK